MLASVELKKRENRDDLDFLQMNGYIPCGIISIWVYFFYQKQVPVVMEGRQVFSNISSFGSLNCNGNAPRPKVIGTVVGS